MWTKKVLSLVVALLGAIGLPWRWTILIREIVDYCLVIKSSGEREREREREDEEEEDKHSVEGDRSASLPSLGEEASIETSEAKYQDESNGQTTGHGKQNQGVQAGREGKRGGVISTYVLNTTS